MSENIQYSLSSVFDTTQVNFTLHKFYFEEVYPVKHESPTNSITYKNNAKSYVFKPMNNEVKSVLASMFSQEIGFVVFEAVSC